MPDPATVLDSRRPLTVAGLAARVGDRWTVEHVAVTGSTNADLAARLAAADHDHPGPGAPDRLADGTVLVTEEQVTGRGRVGRTWHCPTGAGLMFSVAHRLPRVAPAHRSWVGVVLGLAVVDGIRSVTGLPATLKWPNDVLIEDHKCAGILGEFAGDGIVVGAGINVSLCADDFSADDVAGSAPAADPAVAPTPPTSLLLAGSPTLDRAVLLAGILDQLSRWFDRWGAAGGDPGASGLREAYRTHCSTLGRAVRVHLPGGRLISGYATDIAPDGAIVVVAGDGSRRTFGAADVVHLRPAGG